MSGTIYGRVQMRCQRNRCPSSLNLPPAGRTTEHNMWLTERQLEGRIPGREERSGACPSDPAVAWPVGYLQSFSAPAGRKKELTWKQKKAEIGLVRTIPSVIHN